MFRSLAVELDGDGPSSVTSSVDISDLPFEISICILRHLPGEDLAAACAASAVWAIIVRQEQIWRRACEYRWPEAFPDAADGLLPAACMDAPPLVMPPWVRKAPTRAHAAYRLLRHSPHLMRSPLELGAAAAAANGAWRAYYLEHSAYELLHLPGSAIGSGVAALEVAPDALSEQHAALTAALFRLRSGGIAALGAAAAETPRAAETMMNWRGLQHATLSLPASTPLTSVSTEMEDVSAEDAATVVATVVAAASAAASASASAAAAATAAAAAAAAAAEATAAAEAVDGRDGKTAGAGAGGEAAADVDDAAVEDAAPIDVADAPADEEMPLSSPLDATNGGQTRGAAADAAGATGPLARLSSVSDPTRPLRSLWIRSAGLSDPMALMQTLQPAPFCRLHTLELSDSPLHATGGSILSICCARR